ncbi:MAG: protein-(glutamine-N5) methyltransferase, release factor-specific [Crocinitomicaceae bacterium]|nr:protein-(glutamine-N5) methyltransferase, release factor-specific [Crocinitomicaceae bacterium]
MGTVGPLPGDNLDKTVRNWVRLHLSNSTLPMLSDPREQEAVASRLMADLDDRGRLLLEALERRYDEGELTRLSRHIQRVLIGQPVQRVLGWTDFRGLRIGCVGDVLIPRPETEEVVGWFLDGMAKYGDSTGSKGPIRVLDVGTGSGCVALSIKHERPHWEVVAIDVSEGALVQAATNAKQLNLDVAFQKVDVLDVEAVEGLGRFHGIVSNPPYVPDTETLEDHIEQHEPSLALFVPASEPLRFHRALIHTAEKSLEPGGCMVAECHSEFVQAVADCWQLDGTTSECLTDLQGTERAVRLIFSQL